ncbi:MAG: hypothetical protein RL376_909 [Verrucomicrobiota bacterium]|jgi:1,4-dihydroxy-2-naphthoate octaprenyltransferase
MAARPDSRWQIWWEATRPRTLPAAFAPVLVGTAVAVREDAFVPGAAGACLAFALLVQIGTNFANDYYDALKGADNAERVGPRRAVASGLVSAATMRGAMVAVFAAAFLVGLTLLIYGGWPLLVIGVASIACGVAYTGGPYPLAYHGLGDVFVFVFFGLVAVVTTAFVQSGEVALSALVASTGIGALATNILVANNYRDVETDRNAGKRTLLVRWGRDYGRWQFAVAHGLAVCTPLVLAVLGAATAGPAVVLAVWAGVEGWRQSRQLSAARTPQACIVLLGRTGWWLAIYGIGLALSIGGAKVLGG